MEESDSNGKNLPKNGQYNAFEELMPDIVKFHQLSKGGLEAIGLLFSEIAHEALPPQVICQILGLHAEDVKASIEAGATPTATVEQLVEAVKRSVDPGDTVEVYAPIFKSRIQRFENATRVMEALRPGLTEFHTKVEGSVERIAGFFADLAPEPQKGKPMPAGMINVLLRVPRTATSCKLEHFLSCMERNIDSKDTADAITAVLERHLQPHIVFLQLFASGHILPLVPFVAAFVQRGCRVSFFAKDEGGAPSERVSSSSPLGQALLAAGADLRPLRADQALKREPLLHGKAFDMSFSWLPALLADLRALQPPAKVVLYDPMAAVFAAAAEILHIPRVAVLQTAGPGASSIGDHRTLEEMQAEAAGVREWLQREHRLDLFDLGVPPTSWFAPKLNLVLTAEAMSSRLTAEQRRKFDDSTFRCVGTMLDPTRDFRPSDPSFPLEEIRAAREEGGKTIVYLSFGSMIGGVWFETPFGTATPTSILTNVDPDDSAVDGKTLSSMSGADFVRMVLTAAMAALGDQQHLLVIVACGPRSPEQVLAAVGLPDQTHKLPTNFRFFGVVPQLAVLPLCSCHISHGGTGSVMESLLFRVPLVVVPANTDQISNADRVAQAGIGVSFRFPLKTLNASALRDAVLAVIGNGAGDDSAGNIRSSYAAAAEATARQIEETGGPDKAVDLVVAAVES